MELKWTGKALSDLGRQQTIFVLRVWHTREDR